MRLVALDFSFLFWRSVRFYNQNVNDVLKWPMRLFWSSVRHVERLRAEEDLRQLNLVLTSGSAIQSGDATIIEQFKSNLGESLETPMKFEEVVSSKDEIMKLINL